MVVESARTDTLGSSYPNLEQVGPDGHTRNQTKSYALLRPYRKRWVKNLVSSLERLEHDSLVHSYVSLKLHQSRFAPKHQAILNEHLQVFFYFFRQSFI